MHYCLVVLDVVPLSNLDGILEKREPHYNSALLSKILDSILLLY